ncbi:MAG: hypothetical protein IKR49_10830 [Clostridia bacterium]|nr:hypothetical protein [Clostridia bacterium]
MTVQLDPLHYAPLSFNCKVINLYTIDETTLGVELDRTAFFPAGGGQSGDRGTLFPVGDPPAGTPADPAGCTVENVEIRPEGLLHLVKNTAENVKKLAPNTVLHAEIDRDKRFSDIQQHSGEHILSGVVCGRFGYTNVGFHLSDQEVTVDFDGVLTENDICKVENLVNEIIWENRPIRVFFPTEAEKDSLCYRSKKEVEGPLRLVEIEGVDLCACCAPHAERTGEVGALRIVKSEKNKGGTRLWILCGKRALLDTRQKLDQNKQVSAMLSAKQSETAQAVRRLKEAHLALEYELVGMKRQLLQSQADAAPVQDVQFAVLDGDMDMLRFYADRLAKKANRFAFVCTPGEDKKFILLTKTNEDLRPVMQALRDRCGARGGGRDGVMQGSLAATEEELRQALGV